MTGKLRNTVAHVLFKVRLAVGSSKALLGLNNPLFLEKSHPGVSCSVEQPVGCTHSP